MAGHSAEHHGAHSDAHYIKIWAVLLVLLIVSILGPEVAHKFPAGVGKWIVLLTAFGIAFVKAALVIKHFMHLDTEKPVVRYMLVTCLVFMMLFFAGVSPDIMRHQGRNWSNVAAVAEIERMQEIQASQLEHGEEGQHVEEPGERPSEPDPVAPIAKAKFAELSDPAEKKAWLMENGERLYTQGAAGVAGSACSMCHGQQGTGIPGLADSLVGAASLADCGQTASIIKNGVIKEIVVQEVPRKLVMPGFPGLNAEQVAAVTTYMRNSWGNSQGICAPAQ